MNAMAMQNFIVLTFKIAQEFMIISIHYLLIKYKRGPCEALLEIKEFKKVKKHVLLCS